MSDGAEEDRRAALGAAAAEAAEKAARDGAALDRLYGYAPEEGAAGEAGRTGAPPPELDLPERLILGAFRPPRQGGEEGEDGPLRDAGAPSADSQNPAPAECGDARLPPPAARPGLENAEDGGPSTGATRSPAAALPPGAPPAPDAAPSPGRGPSPDGAPSTGHAPPPDAAPDRSASAATPPPGAAPSPDRAPSPGEAPSTGHPPPPDAAPAPDAAQTAAAEAPAPPHRRRFPGARPPFARQVPFGRSVRFRLLLIALIPLLVVLPILLAASGAGWLRRFDELASAKVASDLTVARQHLSGLMEGAASGLSALARSAEFRDARGNPAAMTALLLRERERLGLDHLHVVSASGAVLGAPSMGGAAPLIDAPQVWNAFAGKAGAGIEVFDAGRLAAISPALAARARLPLLPTEAAAPTDRTVEDRGMMILAAAPAGDEGALVGGLLLNRNLAFIDRINELVYSDAGLVTGSRGTATLFLDDVRVSTNVRLFENRRALGTRVSAAVRRKVLEEGRTWLDRAFVVSDWYISAYQPLQDGSGRTIGMLYVGFLDAPYEDAKRTSLLTAASIFALAILIGAPVLLIWARGIFRPLEKMSGAIARTEAGETRARTGAGQALGDEIGRVAAHLDHLLDVVEEREARLRGLNETLEARVDSRTRELREANRRLEAATRQLIVSEKLAAIGEITAGVAHEINNPLAVMQGNLDVVRDSLSPADAAELKTEFALIQGQIQRVHELVSKLLQFSRPEEYADAPEGHDPAAALEEALTLVRHMLRGAGVTLVWDGRDAPPVGMNRAELQQVLVNLMVNAIQAMPDGGRLTVGARAEARGGAPGAALSVADTGRGMGAEVAARVFDPFFTTRHGEGTGLGLSISRKLVERGGGEISVDSAPGDGAVFTIWLPAAG